MVKNFDKILQLAQLTGDRLIVADQHDPEASLVVLPIADYEELLSRAGLTKASSLAKVDNNVTNREVGDISVKSNFVEKINRGKRSPWSIPASRQVQLEDETEDN